MADIETTVAAASDLLAATNLTIAAAIEGVSRDTVASLSGAVGTIDFGGIAVKRYSITGNLSGAFTWPPINYPTLAADGQSVILSVALIQDETGGRTIDLDALFLGAGVLNIYGIPLVDDSPGGITQVDIVARRASGVTSFTVLFAPTLDGSQIANGAIAAEFLPVATDIAPGIVALAPGSGSASPGNHTHSVLLPAKFVLEANGAAVVSGDYDLHDLPSSGTVVRLTGAILTGTSSPAATLTVRLSGTPVTGTGTSANAIAASGDANATAANTFVARQKLQISMTVTTGTVLMATGYIHYTLNTEAWAG